jgi:hypothetical protein
VASKEMTSLGLYTMDERMPLEVLVKNKTIAVVGNSLSLSDSNYGSDIDSHDLVIRFNKPATLLLPNVENSHGTKFDIWAFWAIGAFYNSFMNEMPSLDKYLKDKSIHKIQVSMNGHSILTRDYISHTMPRAMYTSLKSNLQYISKESSLTPSAGIAILEWLRYSQPAIVSIYGFDFKKTPTFSEPEQYKSDMIKRFDSRCKHDYSAEEAYANKYIFSNRKFKLYQ